MTRAVMRAMLRRRLQEDATVAAQWQDTPLNDYLNLGLLYMQKKIQAVDPMHAIYTATASLVKDQKVYAKPANFMYEIALYTKASASASFGDALDYFEYLERATGEDTEEGYAIKGRFIHLHPAPTANVTDGLKMEYVPILSMSADTDIPDINVALHEGIVYRAQMIALGDTDQDVSNAQKDLEAVVADIPLWYHHSSAPARVKYAFGRWETKSE